jgi:hypothetical protein
MRGPHQQRPTRPTMAPIALGRAKQLRWNDGPQRASEGREKAICDRFDWRVGERVDGPAKRPAP